MTHASRLLGVVLFAIGLSSAVNGFFVTGVMLALAATVAWQS